MGIWWWSGWWFGTFGLLFHILGMSSSQLTFIFFRGVGIPPTSISLNMYFKWRTPLNKWVVTHCVDDVFRGCWQSFGCRTPKKMKVGWESRTLRTNFQCNTENHQEGMFPRCKKKPWLLGNPFQTSTETSKIVKFVYRNPLFQPFEVLTPGRKRVAFLDLLTFLSLKCQTQGLKLMCEYIKHQHLHPFSGWVFRWACRHGAPRNAFSPSGVVLDPRTTPRSTTVATVVGWSATPARRWGVGWSWCQTIHFWRGQISLILKHNEVICDHTPCCKIHGILNRAAIHRWMWI